MTAPDLPPVKNRFLYVWRITAKLLSFLYFGLGSILLVVLFFPVMRLFLRPRERFRRYARRLVSFQFRVFILIMRGLQIVRLEADNRQAYRNLSSKIIVANHPSLLDVVMLISLIPNADCIVQGYTSRTILRGVVKQLYILSSLDFEEICDSCKQSLAEGNCIIIFPEGTRTPRSGPIPLKRGAARLALASGCGIVPLRIGGTDKYGLGKRDPWLAFNPREKYVYRISMGEELSPGCFADLPVPVAARRLTGCIGDIFLKPPGRLPG
jgi:1-acyl-sn-glycerol-3-phosphate acyltransferase